MATLHRETNRPLSVIIQRLAGYLLAGRHTKGILALSIHLDSNHMEDITPFSSSRWILVWRATILSLYSGDSAQQLVAPSSDFFEGKLYFDVALWNQRSGYSSESAP
ncbi:hypothetical protein AVEN_84368-1 [Araneus ventricosus]|uniref:Uncharacterized protein n=1 Tax=Araneus ventricosus TaxID=182803 RepID=A0A4Y2KUY1_ARAVE|nr:hypothetical protein AVEN_84368-1 [Araneus ventricosus]